MKKNPYLSGEFATYLSGRYIEFKIFPFSYFEYLDVYQKLNNKTSYLEYLQTGGMPEFINLPSTEILRNYTEGLKNTIILRDIINRYSIKDTVLLENLFRFIMSNIGNLTSIPNIVKYFKSLNKQTNYETISSYLKYLCESFIFFETERFDIRGKQILSGSKKYYLNDLSFKNFLLGFTASDIGYNLENQIYKHLIENGFKVNIGTIKDAEIDFIAQKADKTIYVQVAYLLSNEDTVEREYGNLEKIHDNYPKVVITLDDLKFSDRQGIKHFRPWEVEW